MTDAVASSDVDSILDDSCYGGQEIRESDLCAQWKAADAASVAADTGIAAAKEAKRATDIAAQTFWLSAIAICLSFITALFTLFALRDGRKSAEAAQKMVRLGQPFLAPHADFVITVFRDGDGNISEPYVRGTCVWHNMGERAAKDVMVSFSLDTAESEASIPHANGSLPTLLNPIQGGAQSDAAVLEYRNQDAIPFMDENSVIYMLTQTTYKDALGQVHWSTDRWLVHKRAREGQEGEGRIIWECFIAPSVIVSSDDENTSPKGEHAERWLGAIKRRWQQRK